MHRERAVSDLSVIIIGVVSIPALFQNTMWRRYLLVGLLLLEPLLSYCFGTAAATVTASSSPLEKSPTARQHQPMSLNTADAPPQGPAPPPALSLALQTPSAMPTPPSQPQAQPSVSEFAAPHSDEPDDLVRHYELQLLRQFGLTRRPQAPPAFNEDGVPAVSDHMHNLYKRFAEDNEWEDFLWVVGDKRKELGPLIAVRAHRLLTGKLFRKEFRPELSTGRL